MIHITLKDGSEMIIPIDNIDYLRAFSDAGMYMLYIKGKTGTFDLSKEEWERLKAQYEDM